MRAGMIERPELGTYPLDLSLAGILPEEPPVSAVCEVKDGRIPECALHLLHGRVNAYADSLAFAWLLFSLVLFGGIATALKGGPLWLGILVPAICLGLIAIASRPRWRAIRDLRERRLRIEEGELTQKWRRTSNVERKEPLGLGEAFARMESPSVDIQVFLVRIGGRTHEILSHGLFDALGTGVRYRLHLSAHAGQLVAIESIDMPGGYRADPQHHRAQRTGTYGSTSSSTGSGGKVQGERACDQSVPVGGYRDERGALRAKVDKLKDDLARADATIAELRGQRSARGAQFVKRAALIGALALIVAMVVAAGAAGAMHLRAPRRAGITTQPASAPPSAPFIPQTGWPLFTRIDADAVLDPITVLDLSSGKNLYDISAYGR